MNYKKFLGAASAALMIVIAILLLASAALAASKYKTLHQFTGSDGESPTASLVFDQAGNLYGTTNMGGSSGGTVFKLTPNADGTWTESVIYSAWDLFAPLILDREGHLYGTASSGGAYGQGLIFKLTPNLDGTWTPSVLYSFCSLTNCEDGANPWAGLAFDPAGNLYGTTNMGGAANRGAVFKLTQQTDGSWTESVLYSFKGGKGGGWPGSRVVLDKDGNLYGTAGIVYKLTPNSNGIWTEKVIHRFTGSNDGGGSDAALIFDASGNLYGTTPVGGDPRYCYGYGCGIVFRLTPGADGRWTEKILHQFTGGRDGGGDGAGPYDGLILDAAGNLYGTTFGGGAYGGGVAFKLSPNLKGGWSETVLHTFAHKKANPASGLIFDGAGNLYGTTLRDGNKHLGTVFEITP